jgi:hypothetical protein
MADATNPVTLLQSTSQPPRWAQLTNIWYVIATAAVIATLVGVGAFNAGRQSATLQLSDLTSKWKDAQQQHDAAVAERDAARKELDKLKLLTKPAVLDSAASTLKDRARISELNAQVNTLRRQMDGIKGEKSQASVLALILSSPGSRVLPFKLLDPLPRAVVNLAVTEGGDAAFIAANLPPANKYQLWFVKKDKDDITRGQSFTATADRTILELGAGSLTGVTQVLVTQEEPSDATKPTRPAVMTATLE